LPGRAFHLNTNKYGVIGQENNSYLESIVLVINPLVSELDHRAETIEDSLLLIQGWLDDLQRIGR
jgi:hypothetical protein